MYARSNRNLCSYPKHSSHAVNRTRSLVLEIHSRLGNIFIIQTIIKHNFLSATSSLCSRSLVENQHSKCACWYEFQKSQFREHLYKLFIKPPHIYM